jgi:Uma2 family endonuclease
MTQIVVAKFKVDDYHRMIEAGILDDRRVELLDGIITEMTPQGTPHAYYSDESGDYLTDLLGKRAKVREAKPITLGDNSEPEPDIAIVKPLGAVYLDHHPYAEDVFWLIEYSDSSLKKDLESKTKIYARAGIREYWVINLKEEKLIVFRSPIDGDYRDEQTLTGGVLYPLAFPSLAVSVSRWIGSRQ